MRLAADEQRLGRHHFIDDPRLLRLLRRHRLARQQHRQRAGQSDQPRQAHRAAPAGKDAELHLGQADVDRAVIRGDAIGAGQRQLQPAAQAIAVDGGDGGNGQLGDAIESACPVARNSSTCWRFIFWISNRSAPATNDVALAEAKMTPDGLAAFSRS